MTLAEVVISMFVMCMITFSALAGLLFSYRLSDANLRSLTALSLGRSIAEQLISVDYRSLLGTTLPVDTPTSSVGSLTADEWNERTEDFRNTPNQPADDLQLALNPHITRVTDSNGLDYVQVVIGVRWVETTFFSPRVREDSFTVLLAPVSSY